jgi:hypothetical protein
MGCFVIGKQLLVLFLLIFFFHHNVKILVDLESTNQGLSYEVLHYMVPFGTLDFKIWSCGKQILIRSKTHEDQGLSVPKINQLSDRPYATFPPTLEFIW